MTSFDLRDVPPSQNTESLGMQDLGGLVRAHLRNRVAAISDICFTEIDQAFVIWGLLSLGIFSLAQFSLLSWATQSVVDAALTGFGIVSTAGVTWQLASQERLRWVIFLWAVLMALGMVVTAYGIFGSVGFILINLCRFWLGLCALGYGVMAVGMRSHSFTAASLVHAFAMAILHHQPAWQFLTTGLVMAFTLFFFSVVPWDMQASEIDMPC
ncbi:MAG: hypothetical protein AAFP20_07490 [Cyanobacteria bacterium J06614_10]